MKKIYCFDSADLATVRACFSNPDLAIGNGSPDDSGLLRMFEHDWESADPTAHAALVGSGVVRTYATMNALRNAEEWVEIP